VWRDAAVALFSLVFGAPCAPAESADLPHPRGSLRRSRHHPCL